MTAHLFGVMADDLRLQLLSGAELVRQLKKRKSGERQDTNVSFSNKIDF